jgi:hypothetical protein
MNEIIIKWNQIYTKGTTLSSNTRINTVCFTYDHVIINDSEGIIYREEYAHYTA